MRIVYYDKIIDAERAVRIDEKVEELARRADELAQAELAFAQRLHNEREAFVHEREQWLEAASAAKLIAWKQSENASVAAERVIEIAMLVAEKILTEEIRQRPDLVQSFAADALSKYQTAQALILRTHPLDVALLHGIGPHIEVQADESLERGDVLITGPNGNVDARIRTRLNRIEHALKRSD